MATFIVRVQLTHESTRHYTILRDKLLAIGFTKRITSKEGIQYRLPNGNYLIESEKAAEVILETVKNIALTVDRTPMILITESVPKGNMWAGLQRC